MRTRKWYVITLIILIAASAVIVQDVLQIYLPIVPIPVSPTGFIIACAILLIDGPIFYYFQLQQRARHFTELIQQAMDERNGKPINR